MSSSLLLAAMLAAVPSHARRAGITEISCTGCHGSSEAQLELTFDPPSPAPGEEVTLTAVISSSNVRAAGISISLPTGGEFSIPAGEPLTVSGNYVIHTQPKAASDGQVTFQLLWTAPSEPGSGRYNVAVLAINDDGRQTGDATTVSHGQLAYGCEAITLYRDTDGDGVGVTSQFLSDCDGLPGFSALSGDCDDGDATKYPGAPELCNSIDDDCDGEIDEDVVDQVYYLDEDGDGFGYERDWIEACIPMEGYVDNADDCHYLDPTIHPEGTEVCDFVDNDCDGEIDEGANFYCGLGECRRKSELCGVLCTPGQPTEELCNGLDDDCDGEIDEGFCPGGEICQEGACIGLDELPPQSGAELEAAERESGSSSDDTAIPAEDAALDAESPAVDPTTAPANATNTGPDDPDHPDHPDHPDDAVGATTDASSAAPDAGFIRRSDREPSRDSRNDGDPPRTAASGSSCAMARVSPRSGLLPATTSSTASAPARIHFREALSWLVGVAALVYGRRRKTVGSATPR